VKFEHKRIKTPSPAVPDLRVAVSHSQNFTESPQFLQTVCAERICLVVKNQLQQQENKAQIKNLILIGILMGFSILNSN
jgi:hypothetical protein